MAICTHFPELPFQGTMAVGVFSCPWCEVESLRTLVRDLIMYNDKDWPAELDTRVMTFVDSMRKRGPVAYGPGMTPHADDCECYVCTRAALRR